MGVQILREGCEVSKIELGPLPEPAGDIYDERGPGRVWRCFAWNADQMRSYAEQEVARERERCAKVCEEYASRRDGLGIESWTANELADAIRKGTES